MKNLIILILGVLSAALIAKSDYLDHIRLELGQSIVVENTRVTCGKDNTPPHHGGSYKYPSENFRFGKNHYQISLEGQNAYVRNQETGERTALGCCLIKTPKAVVLNNQVYFFGVGTDNSLFYRVGLGDAAWRPTNGKLLEGDNYIGLKLIDSFILFGVGTNNGYFMAEFRNDTIVNGGWSYLSGFGPRIVNAYPKDENDYTLTVVGNDGALYVRTRYSGFVKF